MRFIFFIITYYFFSFYIIMIDIDLILYKINTSFHYLVNSFNDLFITKTPEDNGYTIITKNRIKYVTYEELWED